MSRGAEIAVIGLAGRFPGARDVGELWRRLDEGAECLTVFSRDEVLAAGAPPGLLDHSRFVPVHGVLDGPDQFDAELFGFSPREAEVTDPQHRLFLECAWEALESAGYDPGRVSGAGGAIGAIGVYAGAGLSSYLINLYSNPRAMQAVGAFRALLGNDKDFLPAWVSYKLDLRGPSFNVSSGCSTSLVAVHLACQALLNGECDMALAGGAKFSVDQNRGYVHQPGGILSPDGHCRAFDARARGTVGAHGAGVVVLKRLADARADGDTIHAVILGSAVNNDGAGKAGFTAPSAAGQARVIAEALAVAGVDASTITCVEAHGTGTELGDPIEIEALTQAFRQHTAARGYCAIGSIKTNLGHLDTAAGIAGLIKAVLALRHRRIPASLHFERPNPAIDFAASPFFVNTAARDWEPGSLPRRAGVSAFGIGGTNAHVILEEAPPAEPSGPSREWQLFPFSARTPTALERLADRLAAHLEESSGQPAADVAFTLQMGRRPLRHRALVVARDLREAAAALRSRDPNRVPGFVHDGGRRPVAFLFPGTGSQHAGMGRGLHAAEPVFQEAFDRCAEILAPHLDLRELLRDEADPARWRRTGLGMPALFAVEYALARLWVSWGIEPDALLGHSLGEYVAACLAGVLSLEDALALVALRGRLLEELPAGAMLAVALPEEAAARHAGDESGDECAVAAVNTPSDSVLAGPAADIDRLRERLAAEGVEASRLHVDAALHSAAVAPILERFREAAAKVRMNPPAVPYLSNVTGTWITAADLADPGYWVRHLRQTVRFAAGLEELLRDPDRILLEVGPGRALTTLAGRHPAGKGRIVLPSLPAPRDGGSESATILGALGRLWLAGASPDWAAFHSGERRRRVPLPTYPFERRSYWIEADPTVLRARWIAAGAPMDPSPPDPLSHPLPPAGRGGSHHLRPALQSPYVAPRTDLERTLAAIWQEQLGVEPVGVRDDFYELGGHSLLLVGLTARLGEALAVDIPLRALTAARTVEELARVIGEHSVPGPEPASGPRLLVRIQPGAEGRAPLFCVHPISGDVQCYVDLARHLGEDQPVYGLQAADGEMETLEEMAARYLAEMRRALPEGPYRLAGWSLGGVIAFEMARQLRESGEEVDHLALLDAPVPGVTPLPPLDDEAGLLTSFLTDFGAWTGRPLPIPPAELRERAGRDGERCLFEQAREAGLLPPGLDPDGLERLYRIYRRNLRALAAYAPGPVAGSLLLLRAEGSDDHAPGWQRLAGGGLHHQTVPGDHYTIMREPHVTVLGRRLWQWLEG